MNGAAILEASKTPVPADNLNLEGDADNKQSDNGFDAKFAALAKMERKNREREQGFSAKEKEWEEKSKKLTEYEEYMKLLDENPLEAIKKKKGWGLKELNEHAVSTQSDEDLDPVSQITKQFQSQMEEMRKAMTEEFENKIKEKEEGYTRKEQEQSVQQFKYEIKDFISKNADEYEFINAEESGMDLVYDVIYTDIMNQKKQIDEDGEGELKMMDVKDAADKVEAYLDKQQEKYLNLKKVKSKFGGEDKIGAFLAQSQPKTLNNSFAPKSKSVDQLDPEERRMEAERLVKSWMANR
jgi:hypothetical protein